MNGTPYNPFLARDNYMESNTSWLTVILSVLLCGCSPKYNGPPAFDHIATYDAESKQSLGNVQVQLDEHCANAINLLYWLEFWIPESVQARMTSSPSGDVSTENLQSHYAGTLEFRREGYLYTVLRADFDGCWYLDTPLDRGKPGSRRVRRLNSWDAYVPMFKKPANIDFPQSRPSDLPTTQP